MGGLGLRRGGGAPVEVAPVGENVDTVLFADRATAFKAMKVPAGAKGDTP